MGITPDNIVPWGCADSAETLLMYPLRRTAEGTFKGFFYANFKNKELVNIPAL